MSRVLVISYSDLARDPRVDRQISFLADEHEVVAAGLGPPGNRDMEFVDLSPPRLSGMREAIRRACWAEARAGSLALRALGRHQRAFWHDPLNRWAARRLGGVSADLVIANDLSALPLAIRAAGDAPVIFDAHEFSPEEHSDLLWWRALVAPHARSLFSQYLPRVAAMMTVSRGIAERYAQHYGVEPVVVTNAPPAAELQPSEVGAPIRLIHHGGALAERRLELMVEAMDLLGDGYELDLMLVPSQPRYVARLTELVRDKARVRVIPPVGQRAIVSACNAYDVGVYALPPTNENLRLALPNKLFEFIQARLAVVVGPSPEMARVVREHDCGLVTSDFTPHSLAEALASLTPATVAEYKRHSDVAAGRLNAEQNRGAVLKLVAGALGS
jgi:glycosyltransferase involved in cell wall biosynthesis